MNTAATLDRAHAMNAWMHRNRGYVSFATLAFYALLLLAVPGLALAQGGADIIDQGATSALTWIKRGVYFILTVAVIGAGVMAAFGRMSWTTVGQVLIGAVIAGVATGVVDALYGSQGDAQG